MKLNRDDEYYKLIYNWVDSLDFIIGYEFLEAKSPNTDAFNHMHMEIKCAGGDITLRVDANGVMITCSCGCMGMEELDYFQVCETQKQLNDLIIKEERDNKAPFELYPDDSNRFDIRAFFDKINKSNEGPSRSRSKEAETLIRRLERNIDKAFDIICEMEDIEQREQYLAKLQEVLGKDK